VPKVAPFQVHTNRFPGKDAMQGLVRPNPNVPVVDPASGGVAHAVVYLRGVDPRKARPWNMPPVRIELRDLSLQVLQGSESVRTGFVRRGDEITMVSDDAPLHSLRARGAAYFTYTLVDRGRPRTHRLDQTGLVELSSGTGYYWMRSYLFVADHPYYARTGAQGRFAIDHVPPGRYQVVCWLPNWRVARQERDPESSLISRMFFGPASEQEKPVTVERQSHQAVDFLVSENAFAPNGR
jgi:hypothetical protein